MIDLITCIDKKGAIGYKNRLILKYKSDMALFREITEGRNIIMGRNTAESIPIFPLKNRNNLILSNNLETYKGCKVFNSLDSVLEYCNGDAVVIGGEKVYSLFMKKNLIDRVFLTQANIDVKNVDSYFREFELLDKNFTLQEHDFTYETDDYLENARLDFYTYIKNI